MKHIYHCLSERKIFTFHVFLITMLYLCISTITPYTLAQISDITIIEGQVIEDSTSLPLVNATISVWTEGGKLKSIATTDNEGKYKIMIEGGFEGRVYAYYDDKNTPGFDYVPAFRSFYLQKNIEVNITFSLIPAASIFLEGEIPFVESIEPPYSIEYIVLDHNSGSPLKDIGVNVYGTGPQSHTRFLDIDPLHIIIPADVAINIRVNSTILIEDTLVYREFLIDGSEPFILSKGSAVHIDQRKYSLQFNFDVIKDLARVVEESLYETGQKGFYITAEMQDMALINILMESAEEELTQELYDECYADLREAYISAVTLNKRLEVMHSEASTSTIILIIFLAFTATALSYLFLENNTHKALATCIIYAVLLFVLYQTYPGFQLINASAFLITVIASIIVAFSFTFIIPYFIKEHAVEGRIAFRSAVTAVFSLAKRNLKRRKLRFTLTLITVTIFVMSFVALTSFSMGYGLIKQPFNTVPPPSDGLFITQTRYPVSLTSSSPVIEAFTPLDPSAINWTKEKSEVILVAPKAENIPTLLPLGTLTSLKNDQSTQIFGLLGIQPSAEADVTNLNRIIITGRYLSDEEKSSVLISSLAAEKLNAAVGDKLIFNGIEVELVGIFNDDEFKELVDLNGEAVISKKVILIDPGGEGAPPTYGVITCDAAETVITTWQTALNLNVGRVFLSRIDAQVEDAQSILPLARRIALERDYCVWTATSGQVYLTCLKSFFEVKGLPILVPWLIVILNVVTTMLNAIFERRREINILSSIGLNPSHITALFVAEATIIGVIGSGVGYLSGLSLYRLTSTLSITIGVRQKVSAVWCLGALGIAATAVLIGAMVAIRSSVIITPSLLRRWRIEEKPRARDEPWMFNIPVKVHQGDINSFIDFVMIRLENYDEDKAGVYIDRIKKIEERTTNTISKRIKFNYHYGEGTLGGFFTINDLLAIKMHDEEDYTIKLTSEGAEDWAYKSASFIRELLLKWSAMKR